MGAALVAAAAWPAGAHALPASGERATVDVVFTTGQPGAASGLSYRFAMHDAGTGDPPVLRRLVVGPPAGAVVDTTVPERCTASDDELRTRGDGICPRGSVVGSGAAQVVVVGLGRQSFTQTAFNDEGQQFQTVKQGEMVSAVVRGYLREEGLDALIPTCITGGQPPEGCPSDQVRLLSSELTVPPYEAGGRSYFTTPPDCPPSGRWRTTVALMFADGVTARLEPEQPCASAPAPPGARACRSRRVVVLAALARVRLRSIAAVYRGRRHRLDPKRPAIDLRGLPRGRYTVRVTAVTQTGRRLRFVRRYRTCTP
jgi:hypothetical protein